MAKFLIEVPDELIKEKGLEHKVATIGGSDQDRRLFLALATPTSTDDGVRYTRVDD